MAEELNIEQKFENPNDKIKVLYNAVSKDYDLGDFNEFSKKLQNPDSRKKFYDVVGKEFDLGGYDDFIKRVTITPEKKNLGFQDVSTNFPIESVSPLQKGAKEVLQEGAGLSENSFIRQVNAPNPLVGVLPKDEGTLPSNYKGLNDISLKEIRKERKEPKQYYNAPLEKGVIFTGDTNMIAPGSKITEEDAKKLPLDVTLKNKFAQDYIEKIRREPTNYEVEGSYFDPSIDAMGNIHFTIAQNALDQLISKAAELGSGLVTAARDFEATSQGVQPTKISDSSTWLNDPLGKVVLGLNGIKSNFRGDLQYNGKLPDTMFGKLVSGGIGIIPDIAGAVLLPEAELFEGAGLLSKAGKFFTKKFPLYLGGTRAIGEYGEEREAGKTPEEAAGTALKEAEKGYGEGLIMELVGIISGKVTGAAMKPLEKLGITGIKGQITKEGLKTITDAIGYGALVPMASGLIEGKKPTEDEFIQGVGLSLPFSVVRIFKNAKTHAQLNDAIDKIESLQGGISLSNFVDATTPSIVDVYNSKETAAELNIKSLEFAKKARETTDLKLKQDYIMQSSAAKKAANVKQIAETVVNDKNGFKEFRESNLPDDIKQAFLDKASEVYKELNPTEQQKTELGKKITQAKTFVDEMTKQMEAETDPVKKAELKYQIDETNKLLEKHNTDLIDIIAKQAKERDEYNKPEPEETEKPIKKVRKPSQKTIQKDIDNGNLVSFTYADESEVPEPFKDKIVSKGETNGIKFVRVTVPKSVADYELAKINQPKVTPTQEIKIKEPKITPKTKAEIVADDVLAHLGITPKVETKGAPAKKYNSKNVDTISEEGLTDTQKKVVKDVKNVVKSVSKLVEKTTGKSLEVNIHETPDSYEKAVTEAGGTKQDSTSKGFYLDSDGTIHLNMGKVTTDTMLHEGFHPVLDYMAKNRPDIINDLHAQLETLTGGKEVIESANRIYEGSDANTIKKEAITDFIAKVADGSIKIDKTNFEKIKDFILNAINKLGFDLGKDINNITDIKKLAELISEKFNKGEQIEIKDLDSYIKKAESVNTSDGINNDYELKDIKGNSERGIQLSKGDENIKDNASETLKAVKTSIIDFRSIPKLKISRTLFYDNTKVGKLEIKNRNTGYTPDVEGKGGFFYSYMPEALKNKAVLAFTSANQAIQTLKRQLLHPESAQAIAAQNFLTAHLGNKSTLKALFGEKGSSELGIFQEAVKGNAKAQKELLDTVIKSTMDIANQTFKKGPKEGKPTASALEIKKIVDRNGGNLNNIKSLDEYRDKVLTFEGGDSFGARNILFTEILQEKPTKVSKSTREAHQIMHYKYGIPTLSEIAEGNNQPQLNNAETGDVVKLVKPYSEPIIYTTNKDIFNQYSENPTDEMVKNGIKIELLPESLNHESYPFVLRGENVGILDNYIAAPQMYQEHENIKDIAKKQSFYNVGRMKSEAPAGTFPVEPISEGAPKFSKEDIDTKLKDFIEIQRKNGITDEDIKLGLEKVADKIGVDSKKINDLLSEGLKETKEIPKKLENKPRTLADEFADAEKRKSEKSIQNAKNKIIKDNFGKIVDELLNNNKIDRIC